MKKLLVSAALCCCFVGLSPAVQAQPKIATIDLEVLSADYVKAKEAAASLQSRFEQFRKDIESLQEDGRKLVQQIQDIQAKLRDTTISETVKKDLEKKGNDLLQQLQVKEREINERQATSQKILQEEQARSQKIILEKIREAIATFSKGKFNLVLNKANIGSVVIMYEEGLTDITPDVLKALNAAK